MRTREIPKTEWKAFFDSFSRQHEGWLVRLDVLGADIGAQHEVTEWPLAGVTTEAPREPTIDVMLGERPEHVTHAIQHVTHVRLEQTDAGADAALQIESADGRSTILQFRAAALPETVDGIADGRGRSSESNLGRR